MLAGQTDTACRIAQYAGDDGAAPASETLLLHAEATRDRDRPDEAAFYLETILNGRPTDELRRYAARRAAAVRAAQGDLAGARSALARSPLTESEALAAVRDGEAAPRRSPRLGGLLGAIPGLGHAYSQEYANACRSFLLNGVFLFGMWHSAAEEQWGAFAAISFFELTWYTGSIYGGIDAAQRFNEARLRRCVEGIDGGAAFVPLLDRFPIVSLRFEF